MSMSWTYRAMVFHENISNYLRALAIFIWIVMYGVSQKMSVYKKVIQHINGHFSVAPFMFTKNNWGEDEMRILDLLLQK